MTTTKPKKTIKMTKGQRHLVYKKALRIYLNQIPRGIVGMCFAIDRAAKTFGFSLGIENDPYFNMKVYPEIEKHNVHNEDFMHWGLLEDAATRIKWFEKAIEDTK